jgi:hypothetical protein
MKRSVIVLLIASSLQAEPVRHLDLTIPEQRAAHIPEKEFFFHWGDYNEPPTRGQMIAFWTLNVLDTYTTHQGLKNNSANERNPLLPRKPKLEELILHKIILVPLLSKHSSKRHVYVMNTTLTYSIINNYEVFN